MKYFKILIYVFFLAGLFSSCKKELSVVKPENMSAFTLVNAVAGSNSIVPGFGAQPVQYFSQSQTIGYTSFFEYPIPSGTTQFSVWQLPDSTNTIFKAQLNLKPQGIYSLFLSGTNPDKPDTLLVQDQLAYHSITDSVAGVRFVNLSPGSAPISVNIQGNTNGSEVTALSYKQLTAFKVYKDTNEEPLSGTYTYEFRDEASGTLLATYTYSNIARFDNVTIVFSGVPGSQTAFLVNNF